MITCIRINHNTIEALGPYVTPPEYLSANIYLRYS
jgi:hypothetical protein